MICSGTDPYQPLEKSVGATRTCIEALVKHDFPIFVFTKSNLITRDIDLFKKTDAVVSMTVTTLDREKQLLIEPDAPSPEERLSALSELSSEGVKTVARIDPLIPTLTDSEVELKTLVTALADAGARHITTSTLKPVVGFFPLLENVDSELKARLKPIYMDGELRVGYRYLNVRQRREMITRVAKQAKQAGLTFGSCREGFPELNTAACDGASYFSGDEFAKSLKTSKHQT